LDGVRQGRLGLRGATTTWMMAASHRGRLGTTDTPCPVRMDAVTGAC
jgi:hypothetical protein